MCYRFKVSMRRRPDPTQYIPMELLGTYLVLLVNQASTYSCSLLIVIHIKNSVIMSLKNKLFR